MTELQDEEQTAIPWIIPEISDEVSAWLMSDGTVVNRWEEQLAEDPENASLRLKSVQVESYTNAFLYGGDSG